MVTCESCGWTTAKCPECGRVFDLTDEADAGEFYAGHDCEPPERLDVPT